VPDQVDVHASDEEKDLAVAHENRFPGSFAFVNDSPSWWERSSGSPDTLGKAEPHDSHIPIV
jgi:hypothetical protein